MELEVLQDPDKKLIEFLREKLEEFNCVNWDITQRIPLAVQLKDSDNQVIAGAVGRSFGQWFLLDTLWVSECLRGKGIGSELLRRIEIAASERGCTKCFLTTLDFQAMPFYERYGYRIQWVQENYPAQGCQYYMVKELALVDVVSWRLKQADF